MIGRFAAYLLLASSITLGANVDNCRKRAVPHCPLTGASRYYPHEKSCNLYYLCEYGILSEFSCGGDEIFDQDLQQCSINGKCDLCISEFVACPQTPTCEVEDFGLLKPYPPDCTRFIYCDAHGNEVMSVCPPGDHFDPVELYCTDPELANCVQCEVTTTTTSTVPPTTTTTTKPPTTTTTTKPTTTTTTLPPTTTTTTLPSTTTTTTLPPTTTTTTLPPTTTTTTLPPTTTTTLPPTTTTTTKPPTTTTTMKPTTTTSTLPPTTTTTTLPPTTTTTTLPPTTTTTILPPTTTTTTKPPTTTTTMKPTTTTSTLPPTTTTTTLPPTTTTTTVPPTTTTTTKPPTTTTTTIPPTTTTTTKPATTTTSTRPPTTTLPPCPETPTCTIEEEGLLKPYPSNCRFFIYCNENGEEELSRCPGDMEFSPELLYCTSPAEANCSVCQVTTPTVPTTTSELSTSTTEEPPTTTPAVCPRTPTCEIGDEGLIKPYPPDCSMYIYCDAGGQETLSLCPSGLEFNEGLMTCLPPDEANCTSCDVITTLPIVTTTSMTETTTSLIDTTAGISECPALYKCRLIDFGVRMPYPTDCTKYIYCITLNTHVIRTCRLGMHFSPTELTCMFPGLADCPLCLEPTTTPVEVTTTNAAVTEEPCPAPPSCVNMTIGTLLAIPSNCSQYLYCASDGSATLSSCQSGYDFDGDLEGCVPHSNTSCQECVPDTSIPPTSTTETITTEQVSTITTIGLCPPNPVCEASEVGINKPYPPDCSKYIYCNDFGDEELSNCAPGLEFSAQLRKCVSPDLANCPYCETTTEFFTSTTELTTTEMPMCGPTPTCNASDNGTWKPYPPDCKRYIYCEDDIEKVRRCPFGEEFSPTELECLPKDEAMCPDCYLTTDADLTTVTIGECEPTPTCGISDSGVRKPYPPDCNLYIYCTGENTYEIRKCVLGLQFSPSEERCMLPNRAGCALCFEPTTTPDETTTPEPTLPPCEEPPTCDNVTTGTLLPIPSNCSLYIYCDRGLEKISVCASGLFFDYDYQKCIPPEEANCPTCVPLTTEASTLAPCPPTPTCDNESEGTNLPVPTDCTQYIYCDVNGQEIISNCASGYEFDIDLKKCVPEAVANCPVCQGPVTTPFETSTSETVVNMLECPPTPTCEVGDYDAHKPYPPDCTRFVYCTGEQAGNGTLRRCPQGLIFDQIIYECLPADEAYCPLCTPATTPALTETSISSTIIDSTSTTEQLETTSTTELIETTSTTELLETTSTTELIETTSTTISSTETTTEIEQTTQYMCPPQEVCIRGVNNGNFLPIPTNCSLYYYCDPILGARLRRCATGKLFDQILRTCVNSAVAYCPFCIVSTTNPTCSMLETGTLKPYVRDCTKYIKCNSNGAEILDCPGGNQFSAISLKCMPIAEAGSPICTPTKITDGIGQFSQLS